MEDQAPQEQQAQLLLQFRGIVGQVRGRFYLAYAEKVEPIYQAVSGELPGVIVDAVNLPTNRKSHVVSGFYSCPDNPRQPDAKEGLR